MAEHKPDCGCTVCTQVRSAGARREAETENRAAIQAVARTLVKLMSRGSLSGPDALRAAVGQDDCLRILRIAGMNAGQIAAGWEAGAPVQTVQSNGSTAAMWAASPEHDARMIAALTRPGVSDAEIATLRAELTKEYRQRAVQQATRRSSAPMWVTRDGSVVRDGNAAAPGVSLGPSGAPQQRSIDYDGEGSER
jgi:hypothetical protein